MDILSILKKMTLKEKIAQITQISFDFTNFDEAKSMVEEYQIGSLILGGSAFIGDGKEALVEKNKLRELQNAALKTRLGIPLLFGRDVIHAHKTVFPINLAMAASFNPELLKECYNKIRGEAVYDGVNWTFAPMLDFCHDPRWGRITECQGEDPYLASKMAAAIVNGFQTDSLSSDGAMAACAKHYIGYGASEGGRDYNHTEISDYALWNNYIPAFRSAIDSGVATVMNSFNEMNGVPVAASRRLLTDVLRDKLGFNGFVISDWGAIAQLKNHCFAENDAAAAKLSINAGIDMDMVDNCYFDNLEELVKSGEVPENVIDTAVLRVLGVKEKLNLFEKPLRTFQKPNYEENRKLSGEMCSQSAVLLKNDNNTLPLKDDDKIALVGPFADLKNEFAGSWSILSEEYNPRSLLEALKERCEGLTFSSELNSPYMIGRDKDVVICALGEPSSVTGEAHSVTSIEIPEYQKQMLAELKKQGKKVVGVLFFGRPVALQSVDCYLDAVLLMWHGGVKTAEIAAKILYGETEPTGRLPVTFPRVTGQIPIYYNALPGARRMNGYYGENNRIVHNYEDCSGTPMYPFGYGLTYTHFEYSEIKMDKKAVPLTALENGEKFNFSVKVKNCGNTDGTEVVQLYVHDLVAGRVRPLRELKGFKKSEIKRGVTAEIEFEIGYGELGYYLEDGDYIVEPGEFEIYIGANSLTENSVKITVK